MISGVYMGHGKLGFISQLHIKRSRNVTLGLLLFESPSPQGTVSAIPLCINNQMGF